VTRLEEKERILTKDLDEATSAKTALERKIRELENGEQMLRSTMSKLTSLEEYNNLEKRLGTMVEGEAFREQQTRISELEAELQRKESDTGSGAGLKKRCNELEVEVAALRARLQTTPHFQEPQTTHTPTIFKNPQQSLPSGSGSGQPDPFTSLKGVDTLNSTPELRLQHLLSKQNEVLAEFVLVDGTDSTIAYTETSRAMAQPRSALNIAYYLKQVKKNKKAPQWQCLLEITSRGTLSALPVADDQQCKNCVMGKKRWCVQTKWEKGEVLVRIIERGAAVATTTTTEEQGSKRQRTR
jgi:hypothetical protein